MRAASNAREASVASDADMIDEEQVGGEKPVSMIGSPMCRISRVNSQNVVERRVRRLEGKGMCEKQRDARRLFLHEDLWDRWSRGLNFAKEMCFPKGGSCNKLRSECACPHSVKASGWRGVGGVDEESNAVNSDECTKEVQRVLDSIGAVEFDPRLL